MNLRRLKQVLQYGWKDAKEISASASNDSLIGGG